MWRQTLVWRLVLGTRSDSLPSIFSSPFQSWTNKNKRIIGAPEKRGKIKNKKNTGQDEGF